MACETSIHRLRWLWLFWRCLVNLYASRAADLVRLLLNTLDEIWTGNQRVLYFFKHLASLLLDHTSIRLGILCAMLIDHSSRVQINIVVFVAHYRLVAFKLPIRLRDVAIEGLLPILRQIWHILSIVVVIGDIQTTLFRSRRTCNKFAHWFICSASRKILLLLVASYFVLF